MDECDRLGFTGPAYTVGRLLPTGSTYLVGVGVIIYYRQVLLLIGDCLAM